MSRWLFPWSGSIKKRACRYLLQHYLGHFLQERLSLDQLSLDLYNGSGVIRDIHLDVWSVNELLDSMGAPLEIVDGFIGSISVTIPWAALVTDNCTVIVNGLQITCRPKYRTTTGVDSQCWSSCMTSSMQLAQECLKETPEEGDEPPAPLEGLEMFAQTIETVLRRIKVTFLDVIIRVEHTPLVSQSGVALEVHIKRLDYCDEAVKDASQAVPVDIHQPPAFVHKILQLSGVQLYYEKLCENQEPIYLNSDSEEIRHPQCPLLIGTCSGYMETTVKIKQNDALPGPKLELDGKMGSLHLLLSTDQIFHLTDLLSSLHVYTETALLVDGGKSRPLGSEDLRLIEEDLNKQLNVESTETDKGPQSFNTMNFDNAEMFYSMAPGMGTSVTSVNTVSDLSEPDMDSSLHSEYSSCAFQPHSLSPGLMLGSPRHYMGSPFSATLPGLQALSKPTGKLLHHPQVESLKSEMLLKLSVGGLTLTLLQEGAQPGQCRSHGPSEDLQISEISKHFFQELGFFKDSMFSSQDFKHLRSHFEKACPYSHVRVTAAAVQLTCEQKAAGSSAQEVNCDLSFSKLEILECLWSMGNTSRPQYTEVLRFYNQGTFPFGTAAKPCAQIHYKYAQRKTRKVGLKKPSVKLESEIFIELSEFCLEFDLGVLDRLNTLILLFTKADKGDGVPPPNFPENLPSGPNSELTTVHIVSPRGELKLQFPVPDLRPEPKRRPSWHKEVRKEVLLLEFSELDFRTDINGSGPLRLEIIFSDLHGKYGDASQIVHPCIRVHKMCDPQWKGTGKKILIPKIVVTVNPAPVFPDWEGLMEKSTDMDMGTVESPCELRQRESSPFSSKRTMFETEEMVIPGDPEEMAHFQLKSLSSSQYVVEVTFPSVHFLLPSKDFYESLYNRINNDLLMWEPSTAFTGGTSSSNIDPLLSENLPYFASQHENFRMCKSAFRLDSDSEEEEAHFCTSDFPLQRKRAAAHIGNGYSFLSMKVQIGKGRITAMTDSKGENGKKLDNHHGELVLDVEGGTIFTVSQYKGDPNLSYFCIEGQRVELYHKAVVADSTLPERLEIPHFTPPPHLNPTIYPSEEGVSCKSAADRRIHELHMLSTAIKINLDLQKNVKEFLVALRLQGATMRHHMAQNYQSWNEQLVDFLNVMDDPILGYTPPAVITVLHSHLLNCAVDYRPLYLPVRILITAETFTLSSNIIVDTATFHLRFILDDSALYLSEKCDAEAVELRKDYVCVLDVDLLELGITTWKGSATGKLSQPLFELRCSNNVVHLHTCADSCAMLVNLLQYIVNSGDLHPPPRQDSPTEIAGQKLQMSESPASLPACLPAETAEINQYDLTDALLDTEKNQREDTLEAGSPVLLRQGSPVSVYLFPGENQRVSHPTDNTSGASEMGQELVADPYPSLGSEANSDTDNSTDNDDFCILEAPGIGIPPKDGEPLVSQLVPGPISIRDGHFSRPLGSSDLLKAPSRFPVPETRIMLREISVVWHLYGGRDFGGKPTPTHSTVHSPRVKSGGHTPARSSPSRSAAPPRPQNSWRVQGGGGRSHSMLMEIQLSKVSFQHESYPSSSNPPASGEMNELEEQPLARQVFIVQELEVRDRLASSQINKFLYLYTSEKMPRRAHSNMLTIKALHIRPESGLGGPECCLRVSLMPLRLNIDQDALFFLKDYFTGLAAGINPFLPVETAAEVKLDGNLKPGTEFMSRESEAGSSLGVGSPLDMTASMETTASENSSTSASSSSAEQPIYFREFRFTSEVPIWLDYQGKHVSIDQVGTFAGILIGLAQLNCSELKLKRLCCRHGLLGVDKVINYAVNEWVTDIRKNQLPGILGGVGPMHSVVQLFHGLRDLFWLPIEQYRKDGRIIRGLQRGAASFGTSTASAALELSNRLVQAIQATAETVYDILSPTPPISRAIMDKRYVKRQRRAQQPADLREGVVKAYDTVREGVIDTAQTICDVATRGHEQKGLPGAVGGVLRQIPPTVVRPLIVATEATSNLLGGMRNQIKPDARKEDFLKWRTEESQD
ncbi:autophagy-related protein 2 homolog A isoform X1 [Polypterus senegalus]|uniref:autophagy-related protein 2 homolog A isoform X1 n=1 Tax=Polypterus senegalus TaxID=55291 RepID=UPI001963D5A8|nr:autophagy-related protein 2 homolog A isoform X1 [Polypterus senegalus]